MTTHTRVPVAVVVALFAVFATLAVARHGFRDGDADAVSLRTELEAERERCRHLEGELERLAHDVAELREGDRGGADRQAALAGTQGR